MHEFEENQRDGGNSTPDTDQPVNTEEDNTPVSPDSGIVYPEIPLNAEAPGVPEQPEKQENPDQKPAAPVNQPNPPHQPPFSPQGEGAGGVPYGFPQPGAGQPYPYQQGGQPYTMPQNNGYAPYGGQNGQYNAPPFNPYAQPPVPLQPGVPAGGAGENPNLYSGASVYSPEGTPGIGRAYQEDNRQPTVQFSPIEKQKSERIPNIGLRVFVVILVVVILATGAAAGGYFAGKSRVAGPSAATSVDLASKPSDEGTGGQSAEAVYDSVKASVVGILVYSKVDTKAGSQASGVVYSEDGYIVTNDHIYSGIPDPQFIVVMSDGKEYDASYVAGDTRSDLAVLKIDDISGLTPAVFGDSDQLKAGESVVAIGNPSGIQLASTVTEGVVSAVNRRVANASSYSMKFIQTDTAINPGSSGGALVNLYGQVIGITSSKMVGDEYERVGFAIPTTTMKRVVDSLIANGYVADRAKLGITYQSVGAVAAKVNNAPRGLYIASISSESDVNGKGVKQGDTITHVNDTPILDGSEILDVIEAAKPGDTIRLTVIGANQQSVTVSVKLIEDKGTSSYSKTADSNNSEFSFPFGE